MRGRRFGSMSVTIVACAIALCAGVVGGVAFGGVFDEEEREIAPIYIGSAGAPGATAPRGPQVVVDDGIPAADARRAARAAVNRFGGTALTVDRDDGRYEVELERPDGTIVEVLVDDRFAALGFRADS